MFLLFVVQMVECKKNKRNLWTLRLSASVLPNVSTRVFFLTALTSTVPSPLLLLLVYFSMCRTMLINVTKNVNSLRCWSRFHFGNSMMTVVSYAQYINMTLHDITTCPWMSSCRSSFTDFATDGSLSTITKMKLTSTATADLLVDLKLRKLK